MAKARVELAGGSPGAGHGGLEVVAAELGIERGSGNDEFEPASADILGGGSVGSGGSGDGNSDGSGDGEPRRRRGRPPGGGRTNGSGGGRAKSRPDKDSVATLSRLLLLVHVGISGLTKTPELVLEPSEADMLAKPLSQIMDEFGIKPDPRFELALSMIAATSMVYGPRVFNIQKRLKEERAARAPRAGGATVVGIRPEPGKAVRAKEAEKPKPPEQTPYVIDPFNIPTEGHGSL